MEGYLHSVIWTSAHHSDVLCRSGSFRKETWSAGSADLGEHSERRRMLLDLEILFRCSVGSSVLLLYCSGMTLAIYEWRESFVEFDPTSCYTTAKAVSYLLFLHRPAISLIRHQISHLANSLLCWPAALGVTAHLVKRKLWFCTSAKDRRGPSKLSQATERLVRWLTLHLHCHSDLFPLFLPKTPGTTPLWGKNESIIHRMRENSPTCF